MVDGCKAARAARMIVVVQRALQLAKWDDISLDWDAMMIAGRHLD